MYSSWLRSRLQQLTSPVAAILLVGGMVSVALSWWVHRTLDATEATQFERLAGRVEREVIGRFERTTFGLKGARAAFVANQHLGLGISRSQFRTWVEARNLDQEFPGVRGFGLIQPVDRGNLQRFIAAERADEAPSFDVKQLAELGHETLFVIKFIEVILTYLRVILKLSMPVYRTGKEVVPSEGFKPLITCSD